VFPEGRIVFAQLDPFFGIVPVLLREIAVRAFRADEFNRAAGFFRLCHGFHPIRDAENAIITGWIKDAECDFAFFCPAMDIISSPEDRELFVQ
jgi:hypothetical protein